MSELEKLTRDVRGFATDVRTLGYSSVAGGHENRFLELSERMIRHADRVDRRSHWPAQSLKRRDWPSTDTNLLKNISKFRETSRLD
jgi:hypothetical protein